MKNGYKKWLGKYKFRRLSSSLNIHYNSTDLQASRSIHYWNGITVDLPCFGYRGNVTRFAKVLITNLVVGQAQTQMRNCAKYLNEEYFLLDNG